MNNQNTEGNQINAKVLRRRRRKKGHLTKSDRRDAQWLDWQKKRNQQ